MQIFQQLLNELNKLSASDQVNFINDFRKKKIREITEITGRDLIVYVADFKKSAPQYNNKVACYDYGKNRQSVGRFNRKVNKVIMQKPYYKKPNFTLYQADSLKFLAELPENSVDMILKLNYANSF